MSEEVTGLELTPKSPLQRSWAVWAASRREHHAGRGERAPWLPPWWCLLGGSVAVVVLIVVAEVAGGCWWRRGV